MAYLEPLLEYQQEVEAAKYLRMIYDSLGYTEKKDACVRFLADHILSEGENKVLVAQLSLLFQQHLDQKQTQQAAQEKRKAVSKTIKWVIPIAVFIAVGLIIALRCRHKRQIQAHQAEAAQQMKTKNHQHIEAIEAERQAHHAKQNALSGRLKRSNQELRELKSQVGQQETTTTPQPQAASFADEAICRLIMERVNEGQFKAQMDCRIYKDYALDKEQVTALHEAANRHFKQFTGRIAQAYPALTRGDLDYCCLYLLGLTDADVSALMQKAYPTVSQRSRKIKAILGSETTLPVTLRSFASDNL